MHEAFTRPALRDYAQRMNPTIARGVSELGASDGPIPVFGAYKQLTLELAASIFVGMDLGPTTRPMNVAFENMVAASMSRIRLPWIGREFQRGLRGRQFMLDLLGGMLEKKHGDAGADMFSRLCRARTPEGESLEDADVLDHMIFLMMAAHDTTTSTLSSLTYELAKHPEWQERVREESRALGVGEPGFDELGSLESLGMAMNETLRRYPPLPVIPRVNTAEFEFGDFQIPAGCMVVVSPIHTHHMSEWWSDPFRWDPDRFSIRARRARATQPLVRALRRRAAHVPGPALRGGAGEAGHASPGVALPLQRARGLHDAGAAGADLEAARRAAGHVHAARVERWLAETASCVSGARQEAILKRRLLIQASGPRRWCSDAISMRWRSVSRGRPPTST